MTRWVRYHSDTWAEFVEQGWVTMYAENGWACMLFDGRKR